MSTLGTAVLVADGDMRPRSRPGATANILRYRDLQLRMYDVLGANQLLCLREKQATGNIWLQRSNRCYLSRNS